MVIRLPNEHICHLIAEIRDDFEKLKNNPDDTPGKAFNFITRTRIETTIN